MFGCLVLLAAPPSWAAEVVWLGDAEPELMAQVSVNAGATGDPLSVLELRAAATRFDDADAEIYRALDAALSEARTYETKLDGELLIMRDLRRPVEAVSVVRDDADRTRLRAALAYQGFAVNRYFESTLGEDDQAELYRVLVDGAWLERPWVDAVALDPDFAVTAYEIAEAPQRIAYGRVQERVKSALPATLLPADLPAGAELVVGGVVVRVGATGTVKVVPGRQLVHVVVDDMIVARWDLALEPGVEQELRVPLDDATWHAFVGGLGADVEVPEALLPCLEAVGGEVWFAQADSAGARVFRVTADGVDEIEPVVLDRDEVDNGRRPSFAVAAMGGWFTSGDFYTQDPATAPHDQSTVNATAFAVHVGLDVDLGLFRRGAGIDLPFTFGAYHVALYGNEGSPRLRPDPHAAIGITWVQLTGGYLFPHHPGVGGRLTVPLRSVLELRGSAVLGLPGEVAYELVGSYQTHTTLFVSGGLGVRL